MKHFADPSPQLQRVLMCVPSAMDASAIQGFLPSMGARGIEFSDLADLARQALEGADVVLISEEMLFEEGLDTLIQALRRQPEWSDIPVLLVAAAGTESPIAHRAMEDFSNIVLLSKPVSLSTMTSTLRMALRARSRQHRMRQLLEENQRAEEALQKAYDELELRVRERTAELAVANQCLQKEVKERRRAEERLRMDEIRFKALYTLNQMNDASFQEIIDFVLEKQIQITGSQLGSLGILDEAENVSSVHGWSTSVMQECTIMESPMHFPVDSAGFWAEAVRRRRPVIVNDYPAPDPSKKGLPPGHVSLARFLSVPVFDAGRIVAVAVVGNKEVDYTQQDIRQLDLLIGGMWKHFLRKRSEAALKSHARKLELRNRELEEFAFIAAHDLREPLRKIQAFGSILESRAGAALGKGGRDILSRMIHAAKRMDALVNALRAYSQVVKNDQPFSAVDLNTILREVVEDLGESIRETGACIELQDFPVVEGNSAQIRRLFQNLIGNALKYRSTERPHIRVYASQAPNGLCRIQVEDNGIGFEERYLPKIFQPFQRLHGKESPFEGTGIGLAICRKVVEHHGGKITARSTPGKGSTFIVSLPGKNDA